eukprot:m.118233 g.118233  ORF g.118233 m.118233 type:complete len:303 (-) comp9227_c0_seq1:4023-4931(-)
MNRVVTDVGPASLIQLAEIIAVCGRQHRANMEEHFERRCCKVWRVATNKDVAFEAAEIALMRVDADEPAQRANKRIEGGGGLGGRDDGCLSLMPRPDEDDADLVLASECTSLVQVCNVAQQLLCHGQRADRARPRPRHDAEIVQDAAQGRGDGRVAAAQARSRLAAAERRGAGAAARPRDGRLLKRHRIKVVRHNLQSDARGRLREVGKRVERRQPGWQERGYRAVECARGCGGHRRGQGRDDRGPGDRNWNRCFPLWGGLLWQVLDDVVKVIGQVRLAHLHRVPRPLAVHRPQDHARFPDK